MIMFEMTFVIGTMLIVGACMVGIVVVKDYSLRLLYFAVMMLWMPHMGLTVVLIPPIFFVWVMARLIELNVDETYCVRYTGSRSILLLTREERDIWENAYPARGLI